MEWVYDILKGAGSIILAMTTLLIPKVREFIIKRYQHSLDKSLEDKKADNERKNYVSKVRFDKEFEIYQELSQKTLKFYFDIVCLEYAVDTLHDEKIVSQLHNTVLKSSEAMELAIYSYSPFISKELCELYREYHKTAFKLLYNFKSHFDLVELNKQQPKKAHERLTQKEKEILSKMIVIEKNIFEQTIQISDLSNKITDKIRERLENIEAID